MRAQDVDKLEQFLGRVRTEVYPEPPTADHTEISEKMLALFCDMSAPARGARVLDVGCGQGVALGRFVERGLEAIGVTLSQVDLDACRGKGFNVREMDQSFLDFADGEFDLLWCRHCLEHSVCPAFTLGEFARVLKPGGWMYVEVPSPGTISQQHQNRNHYSVLSKSVWAGLIERSGFKIEQIVDISFGLALAEQLFTDVYWGFIQRRA